VLKRGFPGPVLVSRTAPRGDTSWIPLKPLVAFAGIANPKRFYRLLEKLGGKLLESVSFPDHHTFARADGENLVARARAGGAQLVTTEKDFVRLKGDPALAQLAEQVRTLPIEMTFEAHDLDRLNSLIEAALQVTSRRHRPPPQR
jgi:tetraacyldisaccharide 4'-kinase